MMLPSSAVSSYLTFSPFHPPLCPLLGGEIGVEVVIFCGTICSALMCVSTHHSRPGSSPVHSSVLSGLSSFPLCGKAITRFAVMISKSNCKNKHGFTDKNNDCTDFLFSECLLLKLTSYLLLRMLIANTESRFQ